MERCSVCGRGLDPESWTCPVCAEAPGVRPAPATLPHPFSALPSRNDPSLLADAKRLGWNWGGFFLPYLWLAAHGRLALGISLGLTALVPFLWLIHLFVYPATAIYLGLNGYELAWKSQPFHSVDQLREREREWTAWGIFLNAVFLLLLGFFLVYVRVLLERALSGLEGLGW